MRRNKLSGPLPAAWSTLKSLTFIDLNNNQLSGTLPAAWADKSTLIGMSNLGYMCVYVRLSPRQHVPAVVNRVG
jgi:hypothetical protein